MITQKTFVLQKLFRLTVHILEKWRHQFLPIVYLQKVKKRETEKRERGGESPCLKDTTKTIYVFNKLIFSLQILILVSEACYQKGISTIVLMQGYPASLLRYQEGPSLGRLVILRYLDDSSCDNPASPPKFST